MKILYLIKSYKIFFYKYSEASIWSSHMIESPNLYTWPYRLRDWHNATKSLPPFLLLPPNSKQLSSSSKLLIDQIPIKAVVVKYNWV